MTTIPDSKKMHWLISSATELARQLLGILRAEQNALAEQDYDALVTMIEEKHRLSQALDQLEQQRQKIMLSQDRDIDQFAMQELLASIEQENPELKLAEAWDTLRLALQECADQNQVNGLLMEQQRRRVQSALKILFSQVTDDPLYDAAGLTPQKETSRSMGVV